MLNKRALSFLALGGLLLSACIADDNDRTSPVPDGSTPTLPVGVFGRSGLLFDASCDSVLQHIKTVALSEVTPWGLDEGYMFRTDDVAILEEPLFAEAGAPEVDGVSEESSADNSETNTQEEGVDEGDTIETNGTHIFRAESNGIVVIDTQTLAVDRAAVLPDGQHHLILHEDRLAVVSSLWSSWDTTQLRMFSVSPQGLLGLLSTETFDGRVVGVRSVEGHLRVLLETSNRDQLNFTSPWEDNLTEYESLNHNISQVENSTIEQWLPRTALSGISEPALDCNQIAISEQSPTAAATTWIATRDMGSNVPSEGQLGIMSRSDTLYATAGSVHFTTATWNEDVSWPSEPGMETTIHSFRFNDNNTMFHLASGTVQGSTIGQFALNEYNDQLRVATTRNVEGISESAVTILTPGEDKNYEVLGEVGGLGLTERIYAVRYIGDLAYIVTFRETDPLYVIDLSDPTKPYAAGELKIPGYSSYLHPIGEDRLLGIGQDADNSGRTRGTQISLFDVSDPSNPLRLDKVDIGGSSSAEYDHKAFLWWPPEKFVATASYDGTVTVTRLDNAISFKEPVQLENLVGDECWWWNSDTRAVISGGNLFTVGSTHVGKYDTSSLRLIDSVSLSTGNGMVMEEPILMDEPLPVEPRPDVVC